MKKFVLLILFILLLLPLHADRGLQLKQMQKEQRVALVIGNNSYDNLSNLKNPINDARAMRKALANRGFNVMYKENASKRDMKILVKEFSHKLSYGGIGMYYFAGHGINSGGKNYLVGVDSLMEEEEYVEYETLSLNYITSKMKNAKNRLNIIVLDACRNNPFGRGGGGGLAPISNAKGIFVAYATEAGSVASDGKNGKNGLFTKHLIKYMNEPGTDLAKVFKNTRRSVYDESDGKQSPGVYDQTLGDFFFTLPDNLAKNTTKIKSKDSSFVLNEPEQKTHRLTIITSPLNSKVTILDINRNYHDGIELESGEYSIEVSKDGFETKTGTVNLYSDMNVEVTLKEKKIKPSYEPAKKDYTPVSSKTSVDSNGCIGCHGQGFEKKALGKSKVVASMTHKQIEEALLGYKNGTYGRGLKGVMKAQVAKYYNSDLEDFAQTIGQ